MEEHSPGGPPRDADATAPKDLSLPDHPLGSEAGSEKRITAEDAEKSRVEKEAAMSKLMDDMEASVETQGQYFIRLGDKVPLTQTQQESRPGFFGIGTKRMKIEAESGVEDKRVLILNALGESQGIASGKGYVEATLVTRDGIKTLRMQEDPNKLGNYGLTYATIEKLKSGAKPSPEAGFSVSESGDRNIAFGYVDEANHPNYTTVGVSEFRGAMPFGGTPEDFQGLVRKSIDKTESPHKKIVENNTAEAQLATSAAEAIRALPPRA